MLLLRQRSAAEKLNSVAGNGQPAKGVGSHLGLLPLPMKDMTQAGLIPHY